MPRERRFRVDDLNTDGSIELDDTSAHHLVHVLRAQVGTIVMLFDGSGHQRPARVAASSPLRLEPTGPVETVAVGRTIHLVVGVLKHQAMDLAVRMATEAGATHIHPVIMERTIAKGDRNERWRRIATAAASQSGRTRCPIVHPLDTFARTLERLECPIYVGDAGAPPPSTSPATATLVIGPAGGLGPRDRVVLKQHEAQSIGLGPHVLRAETACAIGVALLV